MPKNILDFSQYDLFEDCQFKWYERYIEGMQKRPWPGQKDDARTLGSLVHSGLQALRTVGVPTISDAVIAKYDPTPECYLSAQQLLVGYVQTFPDEHWNKFYCEEPVTFPLTEATDGLAKVDCYFRVETPQAINSGLNLEGVPTQFVLNPGVWIFEYKTKSESAKIGNYIEAWKMGKQADFQILALQHKLQEPVQGLFINVLEKPKAYTPKRTCKQCSKPYELRDWLPTGSGFACPVCGNVQQLDTADKSKVTRKPSYYRFAVTRSEDELDLSLTEIYEVAHLMEKIRGGKSPHRATRRCIDPIWGPCEFFPAHSNLALAKSQPQNFVPIESLAYLKE